MNFPSTDQSTASDLEFEVTVDEALAPESASPAKPATVVLVIIPSPMTKKKPPPTKNLARRMSCITARASRPAMAASSGEPHRHRARERQHPLPVAHRRQQVHQQRRALGHPPAHARGTASARLA